MFKRLLAVLLLAALAFPAGAADLKKIRITQAVASFAFLPIDYAKAAGYFAEEGLDVEQIATRGGGPDLTALISGDVEFNAAAGTYQIGAIKAGRDVINVYNYYSRNIISVVLSTDAAAKTGVAPDAPIEQRAAALKGLTIGMTRPGSLTDRQVRHLMRLGGLGDDDVEVVAIGGPPNLIATLERGQIDGFAISIPHYMVPVARGNAVMWVDNPAGDDPSVDPFLMESILTTSSYAAANPDIVKAMIRAVRRASEDIATKPATEIRDKIREVFKKVPDDLMLKGIEACAMAVNRSGKVSKAMTENTLRLFGNLLEVRSSKAGGGKLGLCHLENPGSGVDGTQHDATQAVIAAGVRRWK